MKLKGKLILSCAALAAVATTAFSTTYAWYTANTEVTAKGLNASTGTSNDSSLQISLDGESWKASVDLGAIAKNLTPVQRTANATAGFPGYYQIQDITGTNNPVKADDSTTADKDESAASKSLNVVQFDLYFRNITIGDSETCPVYIKAADVVNANAGGVKTKLLADLSKDYLLKSNTYYYIDMLRALDIEIAACYNTTKIAEDKNVDWDSSWATSALTGEKTSLYKLDSFAKEDSFKSDSDALKYYNTVKGLYGGYKPATGYSATAKYFKKVNIGTTEKPNYIFTATAIADSAAYTAAGELYVYDETIDTDTAKRPNGYTPLEEGASAPAGYDTKLTAPATDFSEVISKKTSLIGTIQSNRQVLKTTWTLYLDGWDAACYDACKGQETAFNFVFTSAL